MEPTQTLASILLDRSTMARACLVALAVGTVLNLIHSGPAYLLGAAPLAKVIATYLVPFLVSSLSITMERRRGARLDTGGGTDERLSDSLRAIEHPTRSLMELSNKVFDNAKKVNEASISRAEFGEQVVATTEAIAGEFVDRASQFETGVEKETSVIDAAITEVGAHVDRMTQSVNGAAAASRSLSEEVKCFLDEFKRINDLASTITTIAKQTNLLALNAAIEAAREGEQGRGFAVVADEVRSLAGQSKNNAETINEVLGVLVESQGRIQSNLEMLTVAVTEALGDSTEGQTEANLATTRTREAFSRLSGMLLEAVRASHDQVESLHDVREKVRTMAAGAATAIGGSAANMEVGRKLIDASGEVHRASASAARLAAGTEQA